MHFHSAHLKKKKKNLSENKNKTNKKKKSKLQNKAFDLISDVYSKQI